MALSRLKQAYLDPFAPAPFALSEADQREMDYEGSQYFSLPNPSHPSSTTSALCKQSDAHATDNTEQAEPAPQSPGTPTHNQEPGQAAAEGETSLSPRFRRPCRVGDRVDVLDDAGVFGVVVGIVIEPPVMLLCNVSLRLLGGGQGGC